jgi:hypothetical protein
MKAENRGPSVEGSALIPQHSTLGWGGAMRKIFLFLPVIAVLGGAGIAQAQQPTKVPRVGFLRAEVPPQSYLNAFRQGLQELGYIEGKNITIEYHYAGDKHDRLPVLVAELVRLPMDVLVVDGSGAAAVAKSGTSTMPIVIQSGNPVEIGLVSSLARPGGNITGVTSISSELGGKLLELLKEVSPRLTRVAAILPEGESSKVFMKETEAPARALKLQLMHLMFRNPDEIERALQSALKGRAEALVDRLGGPPGFYRSSYAISGVRNEESFTNNPGVGSWRGCWQPHLLRSRPRGYVPEICNVCRQDPQRREARRSTRRAADEV